MLEFIALEPHFEANNSELSSSHWEWKINSDLESLIKPLRIILHHELPYLSLKLIFFYPQIHIVCLQIEVRDIIKWNRVPQI